MKPSPLSRLAAAAARHGEKGAGGAKTGRAGAAKSGGAKSGGAKSGGAKSGRAKSGRAKSGGAKSGRAKSGAAGVGAAIAAATLAAGLALLVIISSPPAPAGIVSGQATANYGADANTILFESFDTGPVFASSDSAGIDSVAGRFGSAIRLADTAAYLVYNDQYVPDSGTIEFYLRLDASMPQAADERNYIMTMDHGGFGAGRLNLFWFGKDPLRFMIGGDQAETSPINAGQWYHVALTFENGNMRLYLNGDLADSTGGSLDLNSDTIWIGDSVNSSVVGEIDNLRISNILRTDFPSSLVVWIDTPTAGGVYTRPVTIRWTATSDETGSISVALGLDTDDSGFDGTIIASNLPDSGSTSLDPPVDSGTYYIYAIATSSVDTAYYYTDQPINIPGEATSIGTVSGGDAACLLGRILDHRSASEARSLRDHLIELGPLRSILSLYYLLLI